MSWVWGYLEINKESHSNFTNKETDEREDEGDEEALAGHQGPAAGQEWESEGDQAGGQDEVGDDGELVPRRLEVEMFRHQEGCPGRGEEGPQQHHQGVDSADTAPQHQVTTPTTHLDRLSVHLAGSEGRGCPQEWPDMFPPRKFLLHWESDTKKAEQFWLYSLRTGVYRAGCTGPIPATNLPRCVHGQG